MAKIMVVDDEAAALRMVLDLCAAAGHEAAGYSRADEALERLEGMAPDLVVADLYLERSQPLGFDLLQRARRISPPAPVILITAFATIGTAVEAMKQGAFDYLEKPFHPDELALRIDRALQLRDTLSENHYLRRQLQLQSKLHPIVGASAAMQRVFRHVQRVADSEATILILGESGTGKELVARALHWQSRRQAAPFVVVDCSAMPEPLLESELFGHRKGAFTGAIHDKKGLFLEADGGTVFLDEVASMSATLQSRLLRVLQEHEIRRVGDNISVPVNVRVVAATNEPLERKVQAGTFREDLYYRLNVIALPLPPLRERREDIPLLVRHFFRSRIRPGQGEPFCVSRRVMAALLAYDWPGNVRELENALERAATLGESNVIQVADLPPALQAVAAQLPEEIGSDPEDSAAGQEPAPIGGSGGLSAAPAPAPAPADSVLPLLRHFLREQEFQHIQRALAVSGGDKEKAAEILGISMATLYRKLVECENAAASGDA
ncbi:MAG TPA: sigma-54 dependent transcriptional regulator [Candidatus Paceibacterota bacterium]|nr:sigma-54 dependent transcriptional regulator [Verrucomicrobiota bacterium]HRZ46392.1 sigma-54 dependent transcriptional regulator [Candidatus Paceibacterota bacterium]HRZ92267.1 sigma-54 dependent transcriptional regulator [Candidatus Paceibacterota bacterium]